jgi:hypothetical protein
MNPGMPGIGWWPEDAVRIFRLLLKPIVGVALIATLLLAGRSLAPFVVGEGAGNPAWFAIRSSHQAAEERVLQAEVDLLLASFESQAPVETSERP